MQLFWSWDKFRCVSIDVLCTVEKWRGDQPCSLFNFCISKELCKGVQYFTDVQTDTGLNKELTQIFPVEQHQSQG